MELSFWRLDVATGWVSLDSDPATPGLFLPPLDLQIGPLSFFLVFLFVVTLDDQSEIAIGHCVAIERALSNGLTTHSLFFLLK